MTSFLFMFGFSLYLAGYGFIALFKKEWLLKIRAFSARLEGKGNIKSDELINDGNTARDAMAVIALAFGVIGIVLSIAFFVIYVQAQSGVVNV
ncbi:MAG: hypothetical protein AAFV93_05540 [Chloroflexota bacterium]